MILTRRTQTPRLWKTWLASYSWLTTSPDFAEKHDSNKVVEILRKTWAKMSPLGRRAALAVPLGGALKELLSSALADEPAESRTAVQI